MANLTDKEIDQAVRIGSSRQFQKHFTKGHRANMNFKSQDYLNKYITILTAGNSYINHSNMIKGHTLLKVGN